jgi:hypothetical protein
MLNPQIEQIVTILIALIAAIIAWYQSQGKKDAENITTKVISLFDPGDRTVETINDLPEGVTLPGRTWRMDEETKKYITFAISPLDAAILLKQVAEAESLGKVEYTIGCSERYYIISYGTVLGGGTGPKPA